jgi:hypothetical protein
MKIEVHIVTYNEAHIIGYALRHYATFADRIILHDSFSTDGTREVAALAGAEVKDWDTAGQVNDELLMGLKNTCWLGTDADWVIIVDADEILYFPQGARETLGAYSARGVAVVKATGYEMTAETFPTTKGQIYDEVKMGAREAHYASKPILFTPRLVCDSGIGIGAHESRPILKDGRALYVSREWPVAEPPTLLLHYHHVGPIQMIADRYRGHIERASEINRRMSWGSFRDPMLEATEQRRNILANLEQVIP